MFSTFRFANVLRASAVAGMVGAAAIGLAGVANAADSSSSDFNGVAVPHTFAPDTASILRGPYGYDWSHGTGHGDNGYYAHYYGSY
jgi:hypothetical protein